MNKRLNFRFRQALCLIGLLSVSYLACRKNTFRLRTEEQAEKVDPCDTKNVVDRYICDSWVRPYNIAVKYRFDDLDVGDGNIGVSLVPPHDTLIIPVLRAIKKAWIDVYASVVGDNFIRTLAPKQIVLVGSKRWQSNGTVILGVAEGGKRILLFNINEFDLTNNFNVFVQQIHTIHHEFAHILHQTILYPPAYRSISSPGDYTAQWFNVPIRDAVPKGFVTSYSMSSSDEDFVEVLSNSLIYRRDTLADRASRQYGRVGPKLIKDKQAFVENYLRDSWHINYKQLEDSVQNAMNFLKNGGKYNVQSNQPTVMGLPYPY